MEAALTAVSYTHLDVYKRQGTPTVFGFTPERRKEAGRQFIDVGIAEEQAVAMASAIAAGGGKPVFGVYSTFIPGSYTHLLDFVHDVGNAVGSRMSGCIIGVTEGFRIFLIGKHHLVDGIGGGGGVLQIVRSIVPASADVYICLLYTSRCV